MRDTLVLLTQAGDRDELRTRIDGFSKVAGSGMPFRYYSCGDCVFGVDDSSDVLGDYDDEELAYVGERIGEFHATLVEYQDMPCVGAFLERVLPGLNGLVDTNYDAFVSYADTLEWLSTCPDRHFREGPPTPL